MFTGLRFYAFDKKLFFNTYGSFGDKNDFFFETNYLIKHNFLLDYVYRRNHTLNESVHHIFLNYIPEFIFSNSLNKMIVKFLLIN